MRRSRLFAFAFCITACGSPEKAPPLAPPKDIVVAAGRGSTNIPLPPPPPPAHGRIEISVDPPHDGPVTENPRCHVTYVRASGEPKRLFDVPDCIGDVPRMNMIGEVDKVGSVDFPVHAQNGDEIHLLQIAMARGGNAVPNSEWFAIVIRGDDSWSTNQSFGDRDYASATVGPDGGVVLEEAPTTTTEGERVTITFGATRREKIPMLPSHVVRRIKRVITGEIGPGFRMTRGRPLLDEQVIDEDGPCQLGPFVEKGGRVRMTAEITEWSDGRSVLKCLSITR